MSEHIQKRKYHTTVCCVRWAEHRAQATNVTVAQIKEKETQMLCALDSGH